MKNLTSKFGHIANGTNIINMVSREVRYCTMENDGAIKELIGSKVEYKLLALIARDRRDAELELRPMPIFGNTPTGFLEMLDIIENDIIDNHR